LVGPRSEDRAYDRILPTPSAQLHEEIHHEAS
jgi:hypothetical protein